jgi:hypothetical protein
VGIAPNGIANTYGKRLRQYQRRERMILWVGAGLAGLIGLLTSDLSAGAPKVLNAVTATLIVLGVAALATARIKFEWQATQLDRAIQDGTNPGEELPSKHQPWPNAGEVAWLTGLVCVPVAGCIYVAAVWWAIA